MKFIKKLSPLLLVASIILNTLNAQDDDFYPKCFSGPPFNDVTVESSCDNLIFQDFADMGAIELYNFLINLGINNGCFERKVFYYDEILSPNLFSEQKINLIADGATNLAHNFTGTNNGLLGLFQYLRVAVSQNYASLGSNYDLPISQASWAKIELACKTLAAKPHILNTQTNDANMITGYLFATSRANNIAGQDEILNLVQTTLFQLAEQQDWKNFVTLDSNQNPSYEHSYYFKNHFLFNTFFFYAIRDYYNLQTLKFTERLIEDPYYKIITSLAFLACDADVKNNSITRISEISFFASKNLDAISTIVKENQNTTLYNTHLENALLQVLECSNYLDPIWVTTIRALTNGSTNIDYDLEKVKTSLTQREFPNKHVFEDCKLIIHSSLTELEVLALYESLQKVKAQFFRMYELSEQMPVEGDPNEVAQIRIYNSESSYRSYNSFLFNAPSGGGGIFIEDATRINEDYATMYTYDRAPGRYSLEEIVRHEYVHYLQARYLIKGLWGKDVNPFYESNRLVWFEEGMAEFFSGSSSVEGVIDRPIIQTNIQNRPNISLQAVTQLGYSSQDVYNFGNLVWSNWYKNNRCRFRELADFTRQGSSTIVDFDNFLANIALTDEQNFQAHVNCIRNNQCRISAPFTDAISNAQLHTDDLNSLKNEFISKVGVNAEIDYLYNSDAPRFELTGTFSAAAGADSCGSIVNLSNKLDDILIALKDEPNLNNFDFATAYFSNTNAIPQTTNANSNCNQYSGQIYYTTCNNLNYYLILTDDGTILDPYNAAGLNFDYPDGAIINFNYDDYSTNQFCNIANKAVLITCVEVIETVTATFHINGPLKETKAIWPGDVNYDGVVNGMDVMHIGHYLNQANNNFSIDNSINWQAKNNPDWETNQNADFCFFGNEDLKHADCNRDGIINIIDLNAVEQNWSNTHSNTTCIQSSVPCFYTDNDYQLLLQPIGIFDNNNVVVNIVVERKSNEPLSILSGFINVDYSNNINTAQINFDNTWLGTLNTNLKYLSAENTANNSLEAGFTKTNNANSLGEGILATIVIQVEPNNNNNLELLVELGFQNKETDNFYLTQNLTINYLIDDLPCYNDLTISALTPFQNQFNSNNLIETEGNLTIGKDQTVKFKAENRVRLNTGFSIKAGASFNANSEPCE